MVTVPNGGGSSASTSAPPKSSVPSSSAAPPRSRNGLTASSVAIASNIPLSARVAEPLDLDSVPRRVPAWKEPPARTHINGIPEAPTYKPTDEEWRDPLEYLRKIAPEGSQYGIIKIIPPDSWNPDFAVDTTRFHFKTRKQELNSCEGGTRANLDYLDQLSKFHKSQGTNLNRFPSVDKRPLDLYELKKAVESRGGFERVCKGKKWAEIGRMLGYSGKIMSSLSTSLKNSYAKWLEPYERFLAGAKPAVQWQIEQERGGPFNTPSPGASPMKRMPSQQHTPSSLGKISPAARASDALNDAIDNYPSSHERQLPPREAPVQAPPPASAPVSTSGFTPINTGGFTAINKPQPVSGPPPGFAPINASPPPPPPPPSNHGGFPPLSHPIAHSPNGIHSTYPAQPQPMYAPHDLKRSYSEVIGDEVARLIDDRAIKRPKKEPTAPTVVGSYMNQRPSNPRPLFKEKYNWGPGDYCENCFQGNDDRNILLCESCHNGYHTYCLDPPLKNVPDLDWHCPKCLVGTGEYGFEEGGTYSLKQFQERAFYFRENHFKTRQPFDPILNGPRPVTEDDVEREFWRLVANLTETVEVEYGADIHSTTHGSGFPTIESHPRNPFALDPWNLNILPLHSESLFRYIKSDISGMTVPWLYVGMIFSTFCWHNEDHYAYSANYQHFGETKTWYGIPGADAEKFEEAMRNAVPDLFEKQPDLLFQLVTLLQPDQLRKSGVDVYAVDQRAGQMVITFPQAYHAGFNHGFNFNEAVNFAPPDWEPFGEAGARRLRDFRRQPAFSHDELLLTAASSKDIPIKTAKWLAPALQRMLDREKDHRNNFEANVQDGHKYRPADESDFHFLFERKIDKEDFTEETYVCSYCKTYAYLSRFECSHTKKVGCLDHISTIACCENQMGHSVHVRMTTERLEQVVQKVTDKSRLPEAWVEKFEAAIVDTGKPQLKTLRTLLSEGERIPWHLPQLAELRKFVERCNEWVDEAQSYITRKQQNRRKNTKAWRKSAQAKNHDGDENEDMRKLEHLYKLLKVADQIGFECQEITTLQERADEIADFQHNAREALEDLEKVNTEQIENLIEVGKSLPVEIPEMEHLEKILRQMRWRDKATDRSQPKTLQDVEDLIKEAEAINVPQYNMHLLILRDQKLRGEMWENKAKELLSVENVHFPQLDALSKQAAELPVSRDTLAKIDAVLKKQREAAAEIEKLFKRTQNADPKKRPVYAELNDLLKMMNELSSKPPGAIDIERQQRKHEDWMRKGKRLFGKSNAPLHILHQHLQYVRDRNNACFDIYDQPRAPAEPPSREITPDKLDEDESERDIFCLCRRPESGMMIECTICHEWYHSKCLKIARGKVKDDDEFICPVCDHTKKIPRDADRPKLDEMIELQSDIPYLPFQPEEEDTIREIVDTAQNFKDHLQRYISPDTVYSITGLMEDVPIIRFYLRKIEGGDILLPDETNFFKQELHRLLPIAETAPKLMDISRSTRKPRPTKAQKLMAQYGVDKVEDLPEHLQSKQYKRKQSQGGKEQGNNNTADDSRRTSSTSHSGGAGTKPGHRPSGQGSNSAGSINFRTPLTTGSFPQHANQDNRVGPRGDSPMFSSTHSMSLNGPPSATMPPLGSPYEPTNGSPTSPHGPSLSTNLFDSGNAAGLAALAGQAQAFGDQTDDQESHEQPGFLPEDDGGGSGGGGGDATMFDSSPTGMGGHNGGDADSFGQDMFADFTNHDDTGVNGDKADGDVNVDPALLS